MLKGGTCRNCNGVLGVSLPRWKATLPFLTSAATFPDISPGDISVVVSGIHQYLRYPPGSCAEAILAAVTATAVGVWPTALARIIHNALKQPTVCHCSNPHPDPPAPRLPPSLALLRTSRRAGPLPYTARERRRTDQMKPDGTLPSHQTHVPIDKVSPVEDPNDRAQRDVRSIRDPASPIFPARQNQYQADDSARH